MHLLSKINVMVVFCSYIITTDLEFLSPMNAAKGFSFRPSIVCFQFFPLLVLEIQKTPHVQILEHSTAPPFTLVIFGIIWK